MLMIATFAIAALDQDQRLPDKSPPVSLHREIIQFNLWGAFQAQNSSAATCLIHRAARAVSPRTDFWTKIQRRRRITWGGLVAAGFGASPGGWLVLMEAKKASRSVMSPMGRGSAGNSRYCT